MVETRKIAQEILSISFNQDQSCFVCGTVYGFKIFNSYPFKKVLVRDLGGSIRLIEMLYKTNLLVMVGGGPIALFPPNKVFFWNDYLGKFTGELVFNKNVKAIKLRQNKLAVSTENKVYVYKLDDLSLVISVDTYHNPVGIFNLSLNETLLCVPDPTEFGNLNIINLETKKVHSAKAHSTGISLIEISQKGDLVATAADKGTLIRVFNTNDGSMIHEFRRGRDHVKMQTIVFSSDSLWLACNTGNGEIDVFSLENDKNKQKKEPEKNSKSKLSFLGIVHPYFSSTWYYSRIQLQYRYANLIFLSLGNLKQLVVTTTDGHWYLISYDNKQGNTGKVLGECSLLASS